MKQKPRSNIMNFGLLANMYTRTKAFDQNLFFSKSEAAIHYNSHYHRQRSLVFIIFDQVRYKPACTATEESKSLEILSLEEKE